MHCSSDTTMTWTGVLAVVTVEAPLQHNAAQAADTEGAAMPIATGEAAVAPMQLQPPVHFQPLTGVAEEVAGEAQDAANLQAPAATAAAEVHAALAAQLGGPLQTQVANGQPEGSGVHVSVSPNARLDMLVEAACQALIDETL